MSKASGSFIFCVNQTNRNEGKKIKNNIIFPAEMEKKHDI